MAKRTVMRSSKGKKLYAVRNRKGQFKDIQSYARAHAQDIKRGSTAAEKKAGKKTARKATKRRAAKKSAVKRRPAKRTSRKTATKSTARKVMSRARKAVGSVRRAVKRAVKRATS